MGTKGASYKYGNTRGSNGIGVPSIHINYQYAKDYNKHKLSIDFLKHKKDFGVTSEKEYANHAIHFANTVDRKNCISFIDYKGTTHKYNVQKNTYVAVDKKGYVITYFKPTAGSDYYFRKKEKFKDE